MTARVVVDKQRRTAIECSRQAGMVCFIPLVIDGFDTENEIAKDFDTRWKDAGYPLEHAAKLFLGYSQDIGATQEALTELGKWTKVSPRESASALSRMGARRAAPVASSGPTQGPRSTPSGRPKGFVMLPIVEENPGVWDVDPPLAVVHGKTGLVTKTEAPIKVGGMSAVEKARAAIAKMKAKK